jgi:xanthine dehydrogenase accessory factor
MNVTSEVLNIAPNQTDWPLYGLVDDVRPAIREMFATSQHGALVTLVAADGPTPRPIGSQMVITADNRAAGYVSGGCVESSLELICQEVMAEGKVRHIRFGADSPYLDVQLVCGTSIELVIEPVSLRDPSWLRILQAMADRKQIVRTLNANGQVVLSDLPNGASMTLARSAKDAYVRTYAPRTRIVVAGSDPVALALLSLGQASGFEMTCVRPLGPDFPAQIHISSYLRTDVTQDSFDAWTACVTTTHDLDQDHDVLSKALASSAFYVGALGSVRKRHERVSRLVKEGLDAQTVGRLRAPVGLDIGAATPFEIAISILADIIKHIRA